MDNKINIDDWMKSVHNIIMDENEKLGEWISIGDWLLACSNCDNVIKDEDTGVYPKYCPKCGKPMKSTVNYDD